MLTREVVLIKRNIEIKNPRVWHDHMRTARLPDGRSMEAQPGLRNIPTGISGIMIVKKNLLKNFMLARG